MIATDWKGALWTLCGVPILYLIGILLIKSRQHGDRVMARPRSARHFWDWPWQGSPPRAMGKHAKEQFKEWDEHGK